MVIVVDGRELSEERLVHPVPEPGGEPFNVKLQITPEMAGEMLKHNTGNRRISRERIVEYREKLERGEWKVTNQGIGFDWHARLIDGQTRLMAIHESGITATMYVYYNLEPEAQDAVDEGRVRNTGNQLQIWGWRNASALSAMLRIMIQWEEDTLLKSGRRYKPSKYQIKARAEEIGEESLNAHINWGKRLNSTVFIPSGAGAFMHYAHSQIHAADAQEFWLRVNEGSLLRAGDPPLTLRNTLFKAKADAARNRASINEAWAINISQKAWNAYRRGRKSKVLRWTPREGLIQPK